MAMATARAPADAIGQALVDFTVRNLFPTDDATATAALTPEALPGAIAVLAQEKARLEADIQTIVASSADDVRAWIDNARALEADMARRKTLASDIIIRGERSEENAVQMAEARAQFLTNELNYNLQVRYVLEAIQRIGRLLDEAADAAGRERRVLPALRLLEQAWAAMDPQQLPVSTSSCRALQLLDRCAFEIKADVHGVLDGVWAALVAVDADAHTVTIGAPADGESMTLADTVIAFQAYKEVDRRMAALWHALDAAVVGPRMQLAGAGQPPPALYVEGPTLGLRGTAEEPGVDALLRDLAQLLRFLAAHLPRALMQSLLAATTMVADMVDRVVDVWLAAAVPTALDQMPAFERTLAAAQAFCRGLTEEHLVEGSSSLNRLQEWIENAPRVWLAKRREAALDQVRARIAQGLGTPQQVEKIERQMVSRSEGKELAAATTAAAGTEQSDWDTAWSDEGEQGETAADETAAADDTADDGADAWGAWGDDDNDDAGAAEEPQKEEPQKEATSPPAAVPSDDIDEAADAWGWGEEDDVGEAVDDAPPPPSPKKAKATEKTTEKATEKTTATPIEPQTRELVLRENYSISALPAPVLGLVTQLLEDALALAEANSSSSGGDRISSPIATAAAGLFGVPALVLAMFRAVAPHDYARAVAGSMFLYNDAMYLAEALAALVAEWTARLERGQHTAAASAVGRLRGEVAKLQGFASRAYGKEMAVQKTVLRDLLGGDDNVLQGCSGGDDDADDYVDAAVARVRSMAAAWDGVLAPSAWAQAVGALADAVAHKLIVDVLDMPSISQDEAYALAQLIRKVVELDDLFLASSEDGSAPATRIPTTAQYAPNWLRLQYLSEVLQSNLREVRYLWMESELSLYFSVGEVLDLIKLSFEDNARSREVAREIAAHPQPVPL